MTPLLRLSVGPLKRRSSTCSFTDIMNTIRLKAKRLLQGMPDPIQRKLRSAFDWIRFPPGSATRTKLRWIGRAYMPHIRQQRFDIMLDIARYATANRPIDGYYMEFGSFEANTMRLAWNCFRHLFNWHYISFDSFEGLPEISPIDQQVIWEKGKLKMTERDFTRLCKQAGMPADRLTTIKGFYEHSLTDDLKQRLLPRKAAVVYIDCDLYHSTVPVLAFVKDFLQPGTIIVFDDWNCFYGDPDRGERRAWREFCLANPELRFEPFVQTGMQMSFIHLGPPWRDEQSFT